MPSQRANLIRCFAVVLTCLAACAVLLEPGCKTAPVTERQQVLLIPERQEIAMGLTAYEEALKNEKKSQQLRYVEMVNRVGQRIAAVSGRPDYAWEFQVIESETQNAFALPGGKVAIYEGILPICQSEAGLAVVMSHEVAHALARHGGERMSHQAIAGGLQQAVQYATNERDEKEQQLILTAFGVASQYGAILPYSRKHESEADEIGLMLMAKAGYDPTEAPLFWGRFARAKGEGGAPLEFLSTHPSDARREAGLREKLPQAIALYKAAPTQHGQGEPIAP